MVLPLEFLKHNRSIWQDPSLICRKIFPISLPIWQGSVEVVDYGCKEMKSAILSHHSGWVEWAKRHHSLSPNGTSQFTVFMQTVVATIMHSPQLLFQVPCRECLKVDGSTTRIFETQPVHMAGPFTDTSKNFSNLIAHLAGLSGSSGLRMQRNEICHPEPPFHGSQAIHRFA